MLQISSGILKGMTLKAPKGDQTRPTSVRMRQALFNFLNHYSTENPLIDNNVICDVFAGTGAFGIEALSHGAREVWFVESHRETLKVLKENLSKAIATLKEQGHKPVVHLLDTDVLKAYRQLPAARVVFCDPPYHQGWFEKILEQETRFSKLSENGIFIFEAHSKEKLPDLNALPKGSLKWFETKKYGDSSVHFFVKQPHAQGDLSG